jgi:hypothetical protein
MIPALLPIFLVLRNRFVVVSRRTDAYLLCAMVGMNVIYLVTLLSMAFMAV